MSRGHGTRERFLLALLNRVEGFWLRDVAATESEYQALWRAAKKLSLPYRRYSGAFQRDSGLTGKRVALWIGKDVPPEYQEAAPPLAWLDVARGTERDEAKKDYDAERKAHTMRVERKVVGYKLGLVKALRLLSVEPVLWGTPTQHLRRRTIPAAEVVEWEEVTTAADVRATRGRKGRTT